MVYEIKVPTKGHEQMLLQEKVVTFIGESENTCYFP